MYTFNYDYTIRVAVCVDVHQYLPSTAVNITLKAQAYVNTCKVFDTVSMLVTCSL